MTPLPLYKYILEINEKNGSSKSCSFIFTSNMIFEFQFVRVWYFLDSKKKVWYFLQFLRHWKYLFSESEYQMVQSLWINTYESPVCSQCTVITLNSLNHSQKDQRICIPRNQKVSFKKKEITRLQLQNQTWPRHSQARISQALGKS